MRTPARGLALLCLLLAKTAFAQEPPGVPLASAPVTDAARTEEARLARLDAAERERVEVAGELAADRATLDLIDLQATYGRTRLLFGEGHVSLLPIALMRHGCGSRCDDSVALGVGGAVHLPLFGAWGARRPEFLPVIETDQEAQAYMRFELRARALAKTMATANRAITDAEPSPHEPLRAQQQYELLRSTFRDILKRAVAEGEPLDARQAGLLLESVDDLHWLDASTLRKLELIDELWEEYEYLYGEEHYRRRHVLLAGLVVGTPFDEDIGQQLLLGIAVELGDHGYGFSLAGGMTWEWMDGLQSRGVWVGIGFSGEPSANLINGINGASDWAARL